MTVLFSISSWFFTGMGACEILKKVIMHIKTVIASLKTVPSEAPFMPNLGIKIRFKIIFKITPNKYARQAITCFLNPKKNFSRGFFKKKGANTQESINKYLPEL